MAELSSALFSFGVIFVALAFAAHVGHAVMLANGRRVELPVLGATRQPAFAGVVTGSFVTESTRTATGCGSSEPSPNGSSTTAAGPASSPSPVTSRRRWTTLTPY